MGKIFNYVIFMAFVSTAPDMANAQSQMWSFRAIFYLDEWNRPIFPFVSTVPKGERVSEENFRSQTAKSDIAKIMDEAGKQETKRVVRRQMVSELGTDADVSHAKGYFLVGGKTLAMDFFKTATCFADPFGLLPLLEREAEWYCAADESCPAKHAQLDLHLAKDGKIMKAEAIHLAEGKWCLTAPITYEAAPGQEQCAAVGACRCSESQEPLCKLIFNLPLPLTAQES